MCWYPSRRSPSPSPGSPSISGDDFLAPLASNVLPYGLDKLLIFAVVTSAAASTQTTIIPTARTVISMARAGALTKKFADIHPRYLTPSFATLVMGAVSIVWYIGLTFIPNTDILTNSVIATAFGIAFYYALTGFACVVYYRRELRKNIKNFVFIGVVPALGGLIMLALFILACRSYVKPDQDNTSIFGVGPPLVFGVGGLIVGLILMVFAHWACRISSGAGRKSSTQRWSPPRLQVCKPLPVSSRRDEIGPAGPA